MTKPSLHQLCRVILAASVLALGSQQLPAATNYVTPGDSIQTAVNNASSGDTLIIFGGTYNEDVTVTGKLLHIRAVVGQTVFILGDLTFNGVAGGTGSPFLLASIKVGGDASKRLVLNSCTNLAFDSMDISRVQGTSSSATFSRCVIQDWVTFDNNSATNLALTILQCTITNNTVIANGGLARLLYSTLRNANMVNADSVIVGNVFRSPQGVMSSSAVRLENGKSQVRNNEIGPLAGTGDYWHFYYHSVNNAVWIFNCEALIANNYIHDLGSGNYEGEDDRQGVYVPSASKKIEITGNIFWGTRRSVWSPFNNVNYRYNDDVERLNGHGGGVISDNNISADPMFLNKTNANYQLASNSPCLNAGPTDAWFRDRDGTRNDMGIFGGSAYDPAGKTTDSPITFLLNASPLTVIKGYHTNLTISGAGTVIGK